MIGGIFLDRDGTIIEDMHYLADPNKVALLPKSQKAIKRFILMGYKIFLFTNQSGVVRGMFTLEDVEKCNDKMLELLGFGKYLFSGSCIATETPDQEQIYRKPSPKFILEMIEKHNLDKSECYMVGDKSSDVMAGLNAGIKSIFLSKHDKNIDDSVVKLIDDGLVSHYYDLGCFSETLI